MATQIYLSIRDNKAEFFHTPFIARNIADGMRSVAQLVNTNDANNLVAQSPADFSLHQVATWDEDLGELVEETQSLGSLDQFIKTPSKPTLA